MKKFCFRFYTFFAFFCFIFALCFFGYNLYNEYNNGEKNTKLVFDALNSSLISKLNTTSSTELKQKEIENCINNFENYASVDINKNNKNIYSWPSKKSDNNSKFLKNYKTAFTVRGNSYDLNCTMYLLKPTSIYYYGRVAFLIILIITIITAVLIIYENQINKKAYKSSDLYPEANDDEEVSEDSEEENIFDEVLDSAAVNSENQADQKIAENITEKKESEEEKTVFKKDEPYDSSKASTLPSDEVKPMSIKNENPNGLFSPSTGFGWESYLLTRLNSELDRAIASESDLALFIINIPSLDKNNVIIHKICSYILSQFQFKDLIFEYKNDCFAGIKISMTLEEALLFSEKLKTDLDEILKEVKLNCFIGISTRTVRMITGDRLLYEASEALTHAKHDTNSRIIGFKADANQYRVFMEQNS